MTSTQKSKTHILVYKSSEPLLSSFYNPVVWASALSKLATLDFMFEMVKLVFTFFWVDKQW